MALTVYKRDKHLKSHFKFITPEKIDIGVKMGQTSFFYRLKVKDTLSRFLENDTLRKYIVQYPPLFKHNGSNQVYKSFEDGLLIGSMELRCSHLLFLASVDS